MLLPYVKCIKLLVISYAVKRNYNLLLNDSLSQTQTVDFSPFRYFCDWNLSNVKFRLILHHHHATPQPNWNYWAVALVRDTNVYLPFVHHKINMKLPLCRDLHFNLMSCSRFFKRFFVRLSRVFQIIKHFGNLSIP